MRKTSDFSRGTEGWRGRPWIPFALALFVALGAVPARLAAQAPQKPAEASVENRLTEAQSLMIRGEVDAGIYLYKQILDQHPGETRAAKALYEYYQKTGDYRLAMQYARQLLNVQPEDEKARLDLAQMLSWTGKTPEALAEYRRILRTNPKSTDALLGEARIHSWNKSYPESIALYRKLAAANPKRQDIRLELGRVLAWAGRLDEAVSELEALLKLNPANYEAETTLGRALSWQGKHDQALEHFDRVLARRPTEREAVLGKAQVFVWKGEPGKAKKTLAALLARDRKGADLLELEKSIAELETKPQAAALPTAPLTPEQAAASALSNRLAAAQQLAWASKFPEAIAAFKEILKDQPENMEAMSGLARTYSWARVYPESIELYRTILSKNPNYPNAHMELANVLAWAGRLDEAIREYEKLVAAEPDNLQPQVAMARVLAWKGQHKAALELFDRILEKHPGNLDAILGKGYVLLWQGELSGARQVLEAVRTTQAQSTDVQAFARSLEETERQRVAAVRPAVGAGDIKQQIAEAKSKLELEPNNPDLLRRLGDLYQANNQLQEAIVSYEALQKTGAASDTDRVTLAKYYSWNRKWNPAIELYQEHLKKHPDDVGARIELAKILSWSGRYAESVTNYQELLKARPNERELRLGLARVLSWDKKYKESIAQYALLLEKQPNDLEAAVEQARVMAWQGDLSSALKAYDRILQNFPNDRDALLGKAQVLNWSGRSPEAAEILQALVEKYPKDREVSLAWASVQQSLGRPDRALATLSQVETVDPGNRDARQLREMIHQSLRPELYINFWSALDSERLHTYTIKATHYFNVGARLRSFFSIAFIPSSFPGLRNPDAQEFGYGFAVRATPRLAVRGDLGMSRLSTGAKDPTGSVGISWFPSSTLRFDADVTHRVLNSLPTAVPFDVSRLGTNVNARYEFLPGTTLEMSGFHNRFSDTNRQNGGSASIMHRLLRNEHVTVSAGYLYSYSGFTKDVFSGFFAPRRYQRHAAQLSVYGLLTKKLGYSVFGTLGREMFQTSQALSPFHGAGTGSIGLTYDFTPGFSAGVTYGYLSLAILGASGAYRTNSVTAFTRVRF